MCFDYCNCGTFWRQRQNTLRFLLYLLYLRPFEGILSSLLHSICFCYIPFVFAKFATSALFTIFSSRHLGVSEKFLAVFAIFKAHKILSIFSILAASQVFLITLSILDISAAVSDESRGKYYKVLSQIGMVYCTFQNAKSRTLGCIET